MCFCDIGANIGYFTTLAAKLVGRFGQVLAFEPDTHNYRLLTKNIVNNGIENTLLFDKALGAQPDVVTLFRSATNLGDHRLYSEGAGTDRVTAQIQITTLDQVVQRGAARLPDVIKIDVQGFEGQVFRGMASLLTLSRPLTILTEFWPYGLSQAGSSSEEVYELLSEHGFRSSLLQENGEACPAGWDDLISAIPPFDPNHPDNSYINVVFEKRLREL